MKNLMILDRKDYDLSLPRFIKETTRAIIINDNKIALIHKKKFDVYTFPGGSIEDGETIIDALIRETKEETGLIVKPQSVKEFGMITEIRKDNEANAIYELHSFYYTCDVEDTIVEQNLDEIEKECGFRLAFISFDEAISANELELQKEIKVTEAETYVLKSLKTYYT